ncbi:MAG: SusC/RagA family TonB-linked outer membrane protein [Bacteroidaceae bacterium]|nr:SusC/RagA family TonB-linked outer membrane protein [Bacteroidaceae bacterium]
MVLVSLFAFIGMAMAQTLDVTGTVVSSEDGQPIVGATVKIVGNSQGVITDIDGRFAITVPNKGASLEFSYVGMTTVTAKAIKSMRVQLTPDDALLDEVVVTAMGITRKEKTLGYSAQTVKDDVLKEGALSDATSALAGKVAGLQVNTTSGEPGQANSVIIRGISSINGSNQPLYVVDGVPLQSTTGGYSSLFSTDDEHTTALGGITSINPSDIESMTVLKGAAATALYGSRAANGVIVVTTKGGKRGQKRNFTISYDGSVQAKTVSLLPEFQNKFGQGWNGMQTYIENGSWGPEMDGSQQVYGPIWNNQQLIHTYSAVPSNVKDFFETGVNTSHNVSISGLSNDEKVSYYLSYGYNYDDGIMPSNKDTYSRNTLAFRGSYKATDWLKISSTVNLSTSEANTVSTYQGTSPIDGIYEFPRDLTLVDRKDLSNAFNTPEAWFTPYGITNPYWSIENNYNRNSSKQIFGKVQVDVNPIKQLTLTYRFGFDYTDADQKAGYPEIALDDKLINEDYGYAPSNMNQSGYVSTMYFRKHELNHDFLINYTDNFVNDRLSLTAILGVNLNERYYTGMGGQTSGLTFPTGFWQLSNGSTKSLLSESQSMRRLVGLFADVTIGWDETIFLDVTARNDWSSTLPMEKNSFFYPGATLSYIFTNHLPKNNVLTFGKVRVAYGRTGNDANVYQTALRYTQAYANGYYGSDIAQFPMNGVNSFQAASTIGSTTLKPEMTDEFEAGINLAFFNNRINIDFSYYNRTTKDQIFTLPVDPSTGFSYQVTNFGKVRNSGVELLINTVPVQIKDFKWELGFNFAKNNNKVLSMPESLEGGMVNINSFSAGNDAVYMRAVEGEPIGSLYAYLPTYTEDGKMIVDQNGQPVLTTEVQNTGKNVNYDWTGGFTTSFTWKGISLSAALDIRKGGYMFSRTRNLMQFTGNGAITTYNDRRPFVIPNSVVSDGNGGYVENTTPLYMTNSSYQDYFNDYGYGYGCEAYLMDRSFVKLRNITLAYQFPRSITNALRLSGLGVSFFCNNVFTWTAKDNRYIDPEASSYGNDLAGLFGELYTNPGCRTFGFNLNVKF